jgi:S-adenosylmethionine synthetase
MSTQFPNPRKQERKCPICKRKVTIGADGRFVNHGPNGDSFICEGSKGTPSIVSPRGESAKHRKQRVTP